MIPAFIGKRNVVKSRVTGREYVIVEKDGEFRVFVDGKSLFGVLYSKTDVYSLITLEDFTVNC